MKKLLSLLLAMLMVLSLAACGGSASEESAEVSAEEPTEAPAEAPADETEEPAEAPADPITLRVGYMANYASLWAVMTGIKGGYFEEEGITVQLTEFGDGPSEIAAMEGGSIDLAYIGKGAHRLCITGSAIIFAPSSVHTTDRLVCAADSGIETVEDLAGKRIGYSAGSSSETTLDNALATAGLTRDDVTLNALDPGYIVPAMISGDIDVAVTWNPYTAMCLEQAEGSYEIEFSDGSTNMSSWICLPEYAETNRDVLLRFSRALFRAMDYGADPDNADEVAGWCAEQTATDKDINLLQWGDAHWFNIADMKAAMDDGTMQTYYEGVQSDMIAGGNITEEEARDTSEWVLYDVMQEALDAVG